MQPTADRGTMGQLYEQMRADLKLRRYSLRTQKRTTAAIEPLACRMVVMTAYGTGLRIFEILALETGDIDGNAGIIHGPHGKGDRPRWSRCRGDCMKRCASIGAWPNLPGRCCFLSRIVQSQFAPDTIRRAV